jgi:hypothetical protein
MQTENNSNLAISQEDFTFPSGSGPEISITLERVLSDTTRFGHRLYAKQILYCVDVSDVFLCPRCHSQVVDVAVGNFDYVADVVNPAESGEYLANLLSEHTCGEDAR